MKQKELNALAATDTSLIIMCKILSEENGNICFAVDEGLSKPEHHLYESTGSDVMKSMLRDEQIGENLYGIVKSSFADRQVNRPDSDVLYKCILQCYAEHRPLVLSPDMIWIVINQQLADHINNYSEKYRHLVVRHKGKVEINVKSGEDLITGNPEWPELLDEFYEEIDSLTLNGIASDFVADFSTSGVNERISSIVTLMNGVQSYFRYSVSHMLCGIPKVTIKGTPDDWLKLQNKCNILDKFGLSNWHRWLKPILSEFVRTAEGHPNLVFWKNIVQVARKEDFSYGRSCNPRENYDIIDGWIVALFPRAGKKNILSYSKAYSDESCRNEMRRVGFNFIRKYPDGHQEVIPMELWSGIVGISEDKATYGLTPQIGWFVRESKEQEESLERLREADKYRGIRLEVDEVPRILEKLDEINHLELIFKGKALIPDWLLTKDIQYLEIHGMVSKEDKNRIKKTVRKVRFYFDGQIN